MSSTELEKLRADRRKEAMDRGHTLEEELDETEAFTGSKAYTDCLRRLLGVPVK